MSDGLATQGLSDLADVLCRTEDGIAVIGADRRFVYANPAACRVLARPLKHLLAYDLLDCFDAAEHHRIAANLPAQHGEAAAPFFCVLRGPDGTEHDVLIATFALAIGDAHCVLILRDLTDPGVALHTATNVAQSARLLGTGTTEQILSGVARIAVQGTRAVACGIAVVGEDHKLAAAGGFGFPSTRVSRKVWTANAVAIEDLPGGDLLLTNQTVVLPDARSSYRSNPVVRAFGASLEALDWQAVVHAPLSREGQVFGVFAAYLPSAVAAPSAAELAFCTALAGQAAVVVINTRMAASQERSRLARELHDSVSQALFSMTMHARAAQLSMTKAGLDAGEPLGRSLAQLVELTKGALAEMQALIFELRPGALAEEGLVVALRKQAAALSARELLTVTVHGPERRLELAATVEEHLYRIVSEALHNVVKHARAGAATVTITTDANTLRLTVGDDGAGFDPALKRAGHLGLSTMAQRAEAIDAELTITSAPDVGTVVQVSFARNRPNHEMVA